MAVAWLLDFRQFRINSFTLGENLSRIEGFDDRPQNLEGFGSWCGVQRSFGSLFISQAGRVTRRSRKSELAIVQLLNHDNPISPMVETGEEGSPIRVKGLMNPQLTSSGSGRSCVDRHDVALILKVVSSAYESIGHP